MNTQAHHISVGQLIFLLFCARLFTLLTFMPNRLPNDFSPLVAIVAGGATVLFMGLPFLLLRHKFGTGILEAATRAGGGAVLVTNLALGVFCLMTAAFTIWHFGVFMMSTVFYNAAPWVFLMGMSVAAAYAARLGLEPVARLAFPIFIIAIAAAIAMLVGLWQYMRWEQLSLTLEDGWRTALDSGRQGVSAYAEAVLFLVLASRAGKKGAGGRSWCAWIALSAGVVLWFALITQAALGEYASTKMFPIHAAIGAAQIPSFERLDTLYLFLWCFVAFVRAAAYLYAAGVCLGGIAPRMRFVPRVWTVGCIAAALAFAAAVWQPIGDWMSNFPQHAVWIVLLLMGLPLILLVLPTAHTPAPREEVG